MKSMLFCRLLCHWGDFGSGLKRQQQIASMKKGPEGP
jgi:hypothetical protein